MKIFITVFLVVFGLAVSVKQAKAETTCGASVTLDNYGCDPPTCYKGICACGSIKWLGSQSSYSCNTNLIQNPGCYTNNVACSSNDAGGICEKREYGNWPGHYYCSPIGCSESQCWTNVGPSCGDGSCNGSETCGDCPEDCGSCCTPSCSPACGQDDGCGGTCGTGDAGTPGTPALNPADGETVSVTEGGQVTLSWSNAAKADCMRRP